MRDRWPKNENNVRHIVVGISTRIIMRSKYIFYTLLTTLLNKFCNFTILERFFSDYVMICLNEKLVDNGEFVCCRYLLLLMQMLLHDSTVAIMLLLVIQVLLLMLLVVPILLLRSVTFRTFNFKFLNCNGYCSCTYKTRRVWIASLRVRQ
jgi:hypothetical protein